MYAFFPLPPRPLSVSPQTMLSTLDKLLHKLQIKCCISPLKALREEMQEQMKRVCQQAQILRFSVCLPPRCMACFQNYQCTLVRIPLYLTPAPH